jgi:choline dehydrogenase-like flavoprotein
MLPSSAASHVAVVGAGPAGIVVALELARRGCRVTLVESGGSKPDAATQRLGDAALIDPRAHVPMALATCRRIGGASNIWGGRCVPYDPIDFDARPWIGDAPWPITFDEMARYHQRACDWFQIGSATFSSHAIPTMRQKGIVPGLPDEDVLTSSLERWSLPTNFRLEYGRALASTPGLRLESGLTCVEVMLDSTGRRVSGLRCRRRGGGEDSLVAADRDVIACGGLESTRLLLASRSVLPGGLGNGSGLLGRCYMGHVSGKIAEAVFSTPPDKTHYAYSRVDGGVYVRQRFSFSRDTLMRERLPNIVGWLVNPEIAKAEHGSGVLSFAYLALSSPLLGKRFIAEGIRQAAIGAGPRVVWPHVANMIRDLPATAAFIPTFAWKRFCVRRKVPGFFVKSGTNRYPLQYHAEHLPHAESRVWLTDDCDELGMPRLAIDIRIGAADVAGVLRAHELWDAHLRRHGCGRLEMKENPRDFIVEQFHEGYHQSGTTRMSAEHGAGVVDPNLKVHDVDNLYVASGSVLVTSSQANTTFPVVALAIRLADHLLESVS